MQRERGRGWWRVVAAATDWEGKVGWSKAGDGSQRSVVYRLPSSWGQCTQDLWGF